MKLISKLFDDQFPKTEITHTRKIARCVVFNENNEIALLKLYGDDIFGHRDYYETPGGGVEENENILDALRREMLEEVGAIIDEIRPIGIVNDFYNLINRENINYYFLAKAIKIDSNKIRRNEFEQDMISDLCWFSIDKAIEIMENTKDTPISILCKKRELPILKIAKEMLDNIK